MAALYSILTKQYAVCVYKDGTRTLASVNVNYTEAVKEYAAVNYPLSVIDNALVRGYISEQEYRETIAYVPQTITE